LINLLSSVVSAHLGSSSSLGVFEQHEDRRLGQGCAFAWPSVIYGRSGSTSHRPFPSSFTKPLDSPSHITPRAPQLHSTEESRSFSPGVGLLGVNLNTSVRARSTAAAGRGCGACDYAWDSRNGFGVDPARDDAAAGRGAD
jgi:hypothetical protein